MTSFIGKIYDATIGKIINARITYNPMQVMRNAESITPNDSTDLDNYGNLFVTTGGTITVDLIGTGTSIQFTCNDGDWLPIWVKRVYSTGTSATGIIVMW